MDDLGAEQDQERTDSFVVFQLGGESYALEVARVREVLDVGTLTRVPGGPRSLCGLCNVRGHVVPVWDLRVPFRLDADANHHAAEGAAPCVLMVEPDPDEAARVAGLRVDRVSDVLDVLPEEVQPAPGLGLGGGSAFIRGLITHQGRFLLVMDLDRVFAALAQEPVPEAL
jgi:purine-binding chemotaxis protein CheW